MERNVGFFKSIRFKLIIIYVLLIVVAMQIIGVYFSRQLEQQLLENHDTMVEDRIKVLATGVTQELAKPEDEQNLAGLLRSTFNLDDAKAQFVNMDSVIEASSDIADSDVIGQQRPDGVVKRALLFEEGDFIELSDDGERFFVYAEPVRSESGEEVIGAIYVESSVEGVHAHVSEINNIFITATVISLLITAVLVILLARTITAPILDMRKQALRMGHGDFTKHVHVHSTDEIGQLAMSFNELTKKLHDTTLMRDREQKRLKSVLAHMTDGVVATDQNGDVILLNRRAEELLGVSLKQMMQKPLTEVLKLGDSFTIYDLYNQSDSVLIDKSSEEEPFVLEASFSVIQEEDGPINGLISVLHDVTEKEKIEEERREFVANVSHELRTPLTTMKSYLEALADGALSDEEIAPRFLGVTQNETERMIRLVNDLLQLSKIDSQDYRLKMNWVDLGSFLHEVVDRFEIIATEKNIHFHRHIVKQPMYAHIDSDKITQVLDNIISNAMKYSPKGGNVTVTLLHQENKARISIADEGLGIPQEAQKKIFERFYRVDKARARTVGGTGLGLAIAQEYVHAHDGDIWVHSEYNQGTTIYVTLPYSTFKGGIG
ncbi:cell wall metabolism sensor histidine kinase WalK [Shouchella shacheensis]|uniref:cell wall metabolism sensor histidine kinase WalK n=1 Tax=Shouchella shacheensis TaxID=1649580 RepID=UPI00073FD38F|nr:cell wall metabolism sensor histidine kinase WalK [Shouchella shacheensis]